MTVNLEHDDCESAIRGLDVVSLTEAGWGEQGCVGGQHHWRVSRRQLHCPLHQESFPGAEGQFCYKMTQTHRSKGKLHCRNICFYMYILDKVVKVFNTRECCFAFAPCNSNSPHVLTADLLDSSYDSCCCCCWVWQYLHLISESCK